MHSGELERLEQSQKGLQMAVESGYRRKNRDHHCDENIIENSSNTDAIADVLRKLAVT